MNKKLNGASCTNITGECDQTKGLSCQGPDGAKTCVYNIIEF